MAALRTDLADHEIQVIARGRAMVLPAGATPVDVAYELGSDIGHRCRAAAVNSRVVPLTAPLSDGDVVEIFAAPAGDPPRPREEWLQVVKTTTARVQLRRWFGPLDEESEGGLAERIRRGRVRLGAELRKHDRSLPQERPLRAVCERLGFPDPNALLVAIADQRMAAAEVAQRLIDLVDGEPGASVVRGV
jgi:GTP pyrophosphokinase